MKLLNRTAMAYFTVSLLVVLVSTPLFYLILHRLFIREADETLLYRKQFVIDRVDQIRSEEEIGHWTRLEDDINVELLPANTPFVPDSIYDGVEGKDDYFRELVTQIEILGRPHRVFIRSSMLENEDLLQTIVIAQVAILSTLLLCLLLINWWIAGRIWRPFYHTLEKLREYSVSRESTLLLPESTPVLEFNQLNQELERMVRKIQQDYRNLKQFTENASHEIQTPLAIIKSKLEVMVQDESLSEKQVAPLQTMYQAAGRLSRLNQGLLLLTRIENHQYAQSQSLDLKELIEETLPLFEDLIREKKLRVETSLVLCHVEVNPSLARTLLNNLIGNAIKHNMAGGAVKINLTPSALVISNTGESPVYPTEELFQRFRKANTRSDSLGLGLAIVQEICTYYKYTVQYNYADAWHEVRISL